MSADTGSAPAVQAARPLETTAYRAPLGVRCTDACTGVPVADGLQLEAWPAADPDARRPARRSPISPLFGFGSFPGLWPQEHQTSPASGPPPSPWPPSEPLSVGLRVTDTQARYQQQTWQVTLPFSSLLDVELYSAPSRPPVAGFARVSGEVHVAATHPGDAAGPASWAIVHVTAGAQTARTVCDERGRFLVFLPYPAALPPLGGPPSDGGLTALRWDVTLAVDHQPGVQTRLAGSLPTDPPTTTSLLAQAPAAIGGAPNATATLTFGQPLVLGLDVTSA